MSKIRIVSACDDNYVQHLAVMLCSLLENTKHQQEIEINIIDGGILLENKEKLSDFIKERYNLTVNYLKVDQKLYEKFPISHHFTHTIYYRISMPLLFNKSVDKVLYLDADMVIKDDIKNIWDTDINDYYLAAVEALSFDQRYADLKMPENSLYFCSGLLLINLTQWRKNNIMDKVINFIEENQAKILMWDQDSLNSVLCEQWLPLSLKWNQQTYFFDQEIYQKFKHRKDFIEARNSPSIIHYTSSHKPWHYISTHPYKNEYFNYLKLTPWRNFNPKVNAIIYVEKLVRIYFSKTLLNFIKRLISLLKP